MKGLDCFVWNVNPIELYDERKCCSIYIILLCYLYYFIMLKVKINSLLLDVS